MDNRELFDEVAGTYKREVINFTREEELRASFFPVMYEWYEWKEDPTIFVAGTDFNRMLDQLKEKYNVTPEEWTRLQETYWTTLEEEHGTA